jgi:LAO/AO transport system kinase
VLKTEASRNRGIGELVGEMEEHRCYLHRSGAIKHLLEEKNARLFMEILKERLFAEVFGHIHVNGRFREIVQGMMARSKDPYSAVEEIIAERFGR